MKMQFFLLAVLSLICFGKAALLGAKECTYGPAYWCSSIVKAKSCNAVPHCIQTVWEKEILPEDNDDVCGICKDMVKEARDQLLSNETQNEIRQVFEGSCKLIPITLIQDECIKLSDDFIPELIDTLASQMNPQVVCATAGLCNSIRVDKLLEQYYQTNGITTIRGKKDGPRDCPDCRNFANDILKKAKSLPKSEVLQKVLSMCGRLERHSDSCTSLVQTNFPFIYDYLMNGLYPNGFCELIGFCSRFPGKDLVTAFRTEDEPCDFCVAAVNGWRNNFLANTTKKEFKMILDGFCEHAGKFKSECTALVDEYFEIVYDILVSEIQPKEICAAVGLCGVNSVKKFKPDQPTICTICDLFDSVLVTNSSEKSIRDAVDKVCLVIPPSMKNNCIRFIEEHSYIIVEVLVNHLNPVLFCKEIKICHMFDKETTVVTRPDYKCIACEDVIEIIANQLRHTKFINDIIIAAIDEFCKILPTKNRDECLYIVDKYGSCLAEMIQKLQNSNQVCQNIKLCPREDSVSFFSSKHVDYECSASQGVISGSNQLMITFCILLLVVKTRVFA